jgi:hypothetical protein
MLKPVGQTKNFLNAEVQPGKNHCRSVGNFSTSLKVQPDQLDNQTQHTGNLAHSPEPRMP